MEAMKILVISDLHVGEGAICTDLSIGTGQNAVKQNFLSELKALASRESLEADYLLVTGDITDRALPEEFALAAKKIKEIAGFFNISDVNRILFVPGNHDSNWAEEKRVLEINSSDIDLAIREKYRSIKDEPMFESILRNTNYGCFYKEPYFTIWEFEDLNVVGINTSVFDHFDKKPHHGVVRQCDVAQLDEKLTELALKNSDKINVVMLHHHPIQQPDLPFSKADHSILQNSSNLMDVLYKNKMNLIVHGHKHIPTLGSHTNDFYHPITILCSGSFSARLDDRYFQGVPNMIHMISIDDKCLTKKTIKGSVKSWEHNTGHGWEKDNSKNGIGYIEYFGNTMDSVDIKK
ncbi:TPA: metallophosphoesterase family protein [Vibrio cholerae]|nr:metallophosphoesterase [Vibrio cholerae]EGR0490924.1 metallophosphoesterase [Vibrio cholerae]EKF9234503.1 metallophosphoesterase [Vibrio cholerae]ELH8889226.1 metallophosphoesterase [Vibrio cholerae]ELJ8499161.1 metallophosphoesterase [Vibrio cholerae]MCO7090524.1 metallophosphoesterase [Vibrio cholerae]